MCIDACPVGALTSGTYRYKTRPWEMNHVATVCTHCGDGCKTTLGVRSTTDGSEIVRGDNRDKSGINGDFLCNKGRYAFDFANSSERITQPLIRQPNGELKAVSWEQALTHVGKRFAELRDTRGGNTIGVIGGNRLTNEEAYLLQKFASLQSAAFQQHRSPSHQADYVTFAQALAGNPRPYRLAARHAQTAKVALLVGGDPTNHSPATAWNLRAAVRPNGAKLYIANSAEIKLRRQAKAFLVSVIEFGYGALAAYLGGDAASANSATSDSSCAGELPRRSQGRRVAAHSSSALELRGADLKRLIDFGLTLPGAKFALLGDYTNSRGAADMGLLPDMLPGYTPIGPIDTHGLQQQNGHRVRLAQPAPPASTCWRSSMLPPRAISPRCTSSAPTSVARYGVDGAQLANAFVVVQDDVPHTETAALADVSPAGGQPL